MNANSLKSPVIGQNHPSWARFLKAWMPNDTKILLPATALKNMLFTLKKNKVMRFKKTNKKTVKSTFYFIYLL